MKKLFLIAVLITLFSCVSNKTSYRIYLQNKDYQLTDSERKIENSVPSEKNNATFYYRAKISEEVKLFSDGVEVPHETESWNQNGYKIYYFSVPKPKENLLAKINNKEFKISAEYLENNRHVYLINNNIYISKSASFSGENQFDYDKKIVIK